MVKKLLFLSIIVWLLPFLCYAQIEAPSSSLPPDYLAAIKKRINFFFIYPEEAKLNDWEGDVGVKLTLDKNGAIKKLKVIQPSKYPLLDKAAAWAIRNAAPFPSPPGKEETTEIILSLTYRKTTYRKPKRTTLSEEEKYRQEVYGLVNSYLFYPQKAKDEGMEGGAEVKFTIDQEGRTKGLRVVKSSGYPLLDEAALSTVESAQPYPSPAVLGKNEMEMAVPVNFERIGSSHMLSIDSAVSPHFSILAKNKRVNNLFQTARRNSYSLKIAEDQVNLARIKAGVKIRDLFPSLGVEYSTTEGKTITNPYRSKSYGLKAQHILYDSGQRQYALKRERVNIKVAEESYKKARNELLFDFLKDYYILLKERRALSVLENAQENFDTYVSLGETLKEGALITQIELLKIQNTYDKMRALIVAQQSRYSLSVANLKKIMGVDPEESLPRLAMIDFKEDVALDELISQYIKTGLRLRPEITLWKKSIQATDLGYRISKIENRPKLLLESFWGRSGEAYSADDFELSETWNVVGKVVWLFGGSSFETSLTKEKTVPTEIDAVSRKTETDTISLKANLLDKLTYYAETQEGKLAHSQAEDEFVKLKKDIAWEVQEGFFSYAEAKKRIESTKKELETDNKELELKKELFKAGELDLSDLMDADLRTLQAKLSLLKAKLDMYIGVITLDKATGFNLNLVEKL